MAYQLSVLLPQTDPIKFDLQDGELLLGSHESCQLCISHHEIAKRAAQIDVRGEAVFFRNFNPFPIYVGDHEVGANEETEWPEGQAVLLTKNVSLSIENVVKKSVSDAELAAKKTRQMILAVALFLVAAIMYAWPTDSGESGEQMTQSLRYDFSQLVEQWTATPTVSAEEIRRRQTVLNYFIDARVSDIRWGDVDPRRAIAGYELLLDSPLIQSSKTDSPGDRIRSYALTRVSDLSGKLMLK